MKTRNPDLWIRRASALAAAFALSGCLTPSSRVGDEDEYGPPGPAEHVVHVSAYRYAYEPASIRVIASRLRTISSRSSASFLICPRRSFFAGASSLSP